MGSTHHRNLFSLTIVVLLLTSGSPSIDGVRLAGSGSTRCSGRVEIYYNNTWGTVCDDAWDLNDAEVVCRQLDCGTAVNAIHSAHFGEGTGQIWLDEVACSGSERSLTECQHSGFGTHNCGHGEDAGVICSGGVRLSGSGSTLCSGRVEIYYNNTWGTVCDDGWGLNDAEVVCRQLDCGTALNATQSAHFGEGTGQMWLDNVACSGSERSLTECGHNGFGTHNCGHGEDAGVICSVAVRLAGSGSTLCSGRVEIYYNNTWGTVCDDDWGLNDAEVVCRKLDCGTALSAPQSAHFGEGTGQIWLDNVACSGSERSLTECGHNGFGTHNCNHSEDAGVICSVTLQPSISLTSPNRGLVWGPEGAEITRGYSFVIKCSISPVNPGGFFHLIFSDSDITDTKSAVNYSASFDFPAAEYEHQVPLSLVASLVTSGVLLLLLLLLLVVCVFHRRRQQINQPGSAIVNQMNIKNSSEDDEDNRVYVNIEPFNTKRKQKEKVGGTKEEDDDDGYEMLDTKNNYTVYGDLFGTGQDKREEEDDVKSSD
ncbi:deleted in malignant brain tumors 1 protein-like [Channa argus]|uniref:deleted in malignant brain tumors 1 protein-like n=1 Tax=Channa argus TaxID=215402 RepID=UPI00352309F3